jgi:hypothetical protein
VVVERLRTPLSLVVVVVVSLLVVAGAVTTVAVGGAVSSFLYVKQLARNCSESAIIARVIRRLWFLMISFLCVGGWMRLEIRQNIAEGIGAVNS